MPSFLSSSLRIFDLSLSRMLWSRSTIFMALVVGLPVVIAAIVRGLEVAGLRWRPGGQAWRSAGRRCSGR